MRERFAARPVTPPHSGDLARHDPRPGPGTDRRRRTTRSRETLRGRARPPTPDWTVELGIGVGAPPSEIHAGGCYAAGKRQRTIDRGQARQLLADGVRACTHCRPDSELGVLE
ncbi:DUF6233 domain-containing protein [Streptomyces sp. SID9727]|uniref:DUF6233 domain-containing protein n=1 Tax=Streptomyces sp. SID9727 TaxID=2706114 RepID=UPI001EF17812|nr:DUF6233 domain-containing protein [Streptomyces sp. SID9727]